MNSTQTQTQTQLPTDQLVIFTPHNEQLKNDLLSRKVDNVIVSTIDGNKIIDLVYQDFIFCDGVIQASVENAPLYCPVFFIEDDETIEDIFKRYDGEIYHTVDKLSVLNKTRSQLVEICGEEGENAESLGEITIVTAFDSKDKYSFGYMLTNDFEHETEESVCKSVTFEVNQYSKRQIDFEAPVSEEHAIRAAEQFLSKSLDKKYYDLVADDLRDECSSWKEANKLYKCRGDCLHSICIEKSTLIDGHLTFTLLV